MPTHTRAPLQAAEPSTAPPPAPSCMRRSSLISLMLTVGASDDSGGLPLGSLYTDKRKHKAADKSDRKIPDIELTTLLAINTRGGDYAPPGARDLHTPPSPAQDDPRLLPACIPCSYGGIVGNALGTTGTGLFIHADSAPSVRDAANIDSADVRARLDALIVEAAHKDQTGAGSANEILHDARRALHRNLAICAAVLCGSARGAAEPYDPAGPIVPRMTSTSWLSDEPARRAIECMDEQRRAEAQVACHPRHLRIPEGFCTNISLRNVY
ncbi:hypothetical protein HYPSUDRAFT_208951 [Hypholoma sublateritium FD-334 SS-4]|uniref:Uncharacterized protein n=1 Tax=Hypholoma sublateritium (strain FD-334 SS-4) TaxID=945553 RepID=A0A0D2NC57_HYPSF|nr:hypothetical protein HYPSUDRAFT_208951 [Hypholoma sublateritium FD-334 SS-4]